MSELTRVTALTGLAAVLCLAPASANAAPGKGNGNGGAPPHAGSGNPHQPGETGNPHDGGHGNPHVGSPPYGRALGQGGAAGTGGAADANAVSAAANGRGANGNLDRPLGKTTICHATNSETNPFVKITVSNAALPAHARHGDVIPAPGGECDDDSALTPESAGGGGSDGATGSGGSEGESGGGTLASEGSGGGSAAESASDPGDTLPFTGFAAMTLACVGIVLGCMGLLVRALERGPAQD